MVTLVVDGGDFSIVRRSFALSDILIIRSPPLDTAYISGVPEEVGTGASGRGDGSGATGGFGLGWGGCFRVSHEAGRGWGSGHSSYYSNDSGELVCPPPALPRS